MGQARNRKQRFLQAHPLCCFCGGETASEQEDHVPPRSAFLGRDWPEGYVFPACASCNNGSSVADRLFALAAYVDANEPTDEQRREWQALLREVARDHPGLPQRMLLTANEKRNYLRSMDLNPPAGLAAAESGLVQLPEEILVAIDLVLKKLARALHYKHAGRIVPKDGHVRVRYFPSQELAQTMDQDVLALFAKSDKMTRNGKDLSAQFSCSYQTSEDGELGAYLCRVRTSIVAVILVSISVPFADEGMVSSV